MLFDETMIIHSQLEDGRHWLTTLDVPSLQLLPVAPNHCRVGHFLATVIAAKLAQSTDAVSEMSLTRRDVAGIRSLASSYPELEEEAAEVRMRLVLQAGPPDTDDDEDAAPSEFVTPQPPAGWSESYDAWIVFAGRSLGMDVPAPNTDPNGYELDMAKASAEFQRRLPDLRRRYLAGMKGLNLGFKVALKTRSGGLEYVWVSPKDWKDEHVLVCTLESQPLDCKGYKQGQTLKLQLSELYDYAIGSETAGLVDGGVTQRIAEEYGLVVP